MLTITKSLQWDMGHRVPDHNGQCRYPHGHRYTAEFTLAGPVVDTVGAADRGMVLDFQDVVLALRDVIAPLDHAFMLADFDPDRALFGQMSAAKLVFVPFVPTAEQIALYLLAGAKEALGAEAGLIADRGHRVTVAKVRVYETPSSWAEVTA